MHVALQRLFITSYLRQSYTVLWWIPRKVINKVGDVWWWDVGSQRWIFEKLISLFIWLQLFCLAWPMVVVYWFIYLHFIAMVYCADPSCRNGSGKRNHQEPGTRYHKFPREEGIARRWWQIIKRGETFPKNYRQHSLCSAHFEKYDYQRDLKLELLQMPSKPSSGTRLLHTAVPSRNLSRPVR